MAYKPNEELAYTDLLLRKVPPFNLSFRLFCVNISLKIRFLSLTSPAFVAMVHVDH